MKTVQLDIQDDKLNDFLTIIDNLKNEMIDTIRFQNDILDIENIEKDSSDYLDIQETKNENNKSYSIEEAKEKLGL
ncbi:MAG: hypothetical protein U9N52_13185 [Campylobacterota bacterium]|nr:hypothetical protein [Campylobacterota bacterium]